MKNVSDEKGSQSLFCVSWSDVAARARRVIGLAASNASKLEIKLIRVVWGSGLQAPCALLITIAPTICFAQTAKEDYDEILRLDRARVSELDRAWGNNATRKIDPQAFEKASSIIVEQINLRSALEQLAQKGDTDARYYIGLLEYVEGRASEDTAHSQNDPNWLVIAREDFAKSVKWLKPLAEEGYPAAQWRYGNLFAEGRGVNQSSSNAIEWWLKAANKYLKAGDREDALTLLDAMSQLDSSNPQVGKLRRVIYSADR